MRPEKEILSPIQRRGQAQNTVRLADQHMKLDALQRLPGEAPAEGVRIELDVRKFFASSSPHIRRLRKRSGPITTGAPIWKIASPN
jgi:hypothetical protein